LATLSDIQRWQKRLAPLLWPLSQLYGAGVRFYHHLYDIGYRPTVHFELPVISVGNLTAGGTGKTPHVEYLIELLSPHYRTATLSRGYGRTTKGFVLADEQATADRIGDEPMQFYRKFGQKMTVAVGEERLLAIPEILHQQPETELVIMDDAYQHRPVGRQLNLLLCEYGRPFFQDHLLPLGMLREPRKAARRADAVVVSKCPPDFSETDKAYFEQQLQPYLLPGTPIFFSSLQYKPLECVGHSSKNMPTTIEKSENIVVLSGIANPQSLHNYLQTQYKLVGKLVLPDHYRYTATKVNEVIDFFHHTKATAVVTTEKDMVKLLAPAFRDSLAHIPLYCLPVGVSFGNDQARFNRFVLEKIRQTIENLAF
jgi:tetraacyldisaccharide 4'-kinase